jgi:hypothetical protein
MINVFKAGGAWKSGDFDYTVKSVNRSKVAELIEEGYSLTLDEAKKATPKKVASKKVVDKNDDKGPNS